MRETTVRPLERRDRAAIAGLLGRCAEFKPEEVACALELVDDAIRGASNDEDYRALCAELPGEGVAGFLLYGKTPLTRFAWDLYWIVADPSHRGKGVGRGLLAALEESLEAKGARLLLAETSSIEAYEPARMFYRREGFGEESRIAHFYAPGDDRIIFVKRFEDRSGPDRRRAKSRPGGRVKGRRARCSRD